ncbi:CMRF35-like molecule 9 [Chelmon rostratus]|uniref:CMRF35-like molecule 9 n=1 Tax=Chelmon rostratus TaxID=109905 RepID=UPI001BEB5016|nr:CMRF35-like molecule 9 [Chelmon rostratus]
MIRICAFSCLLSALSVVEMKPLNIKGHVGETVTIKCSDWDTWFSVKSNVKYWCYSPCSDNKHIIIKAAFGETKHRNRIKLVNNGADAFVTFTNLQKSDSDKYYCGVDKFGFDLKTEVNLEVTEAESSRPKTTPKAFDVNTSTMSSSSSDIITDISTSHIIQPTTTPASEIARAGSVPYLIVGVCVIITILMALLTLMRKMMMKQLKEEDAQEDIEYDEIRLEDQQGVSRPAEVSTLRFSADPNSLYANYSYHQDTELAASDSVVYSKVAYAKNRANGLQCDLVYSVAQLPTGQSKPIRSESTENDSLYSLAQLPQTT